MPTPAALNLRIADRLLEDGLITQGDHRQAVEYARSRQWRVEEALLELDVIDEVELLRYLAKLHRTQFVSTERLSKAKVDQAALRMVPRRLVDMYGVYPLLFDQKTQRLVVATPDPDNLAALDDLRAATPARDLRALVARPAAIQAAVARGYEGERYAFTNLLRGTGNASDLDLRDPFQRQTARQPRAERPAAQPPAQAPWPRRATESSEVRDIRKQARPDPGGGHRPWRPHRTPTAERLGLAPADEARMVADALEEEGAMMADPVRAPAAPALPQDLPPSPVAPPVAPAAPAVSKAPKPVPPPPAGLQRRARSADDRAGQYSATATEPSQSPPAVELPIVGGPAAELDDPFAGAPAQDILAPPSNAPEAVEPTIPLDALVPSRPVKRSSDARIPLQAEPVEPETEPAPSSQRSLPPPPSRLNLGPLSRRSDRPAPLSTRPTGAQLIEVLRVLVGLLENERADLRGHSSMVARLLQDACERIGLSEAHTGALVLAAYLHDLGKRSSAPAARRRHGEEEAPPVHLTALNVAHFKSYRELARKLVGLPEQLMEAVGLPEQTLTAMRTMYEQVDGDGVPASMPGKAIPIGGRILAVADSYADLTQNERNTYERLLSPEKAMEVLRENVSTVFDPNIVEVFGHATTGEQILTQLLDERHRVLIVDPDPEQTLVLQLRLSDQGFEVHVARNTKEARAALEKRKIALVVSEIDLEEPEAGLFLREEVTKNDAYSDLCWVFLSGRSSRNTAKRAFDMGVDDFIAKPASVEIVVAKLVQLVEREAKRKPTAARGVSGSLSDMAMTDIVQILFHGQRTCALQIEWPDQKGELHFKDGRIVQAILGDMEGENAFYRMLSLGEDGQFQVDPTFAPSGEPAINASPEMLLLEGMRLLDEGLVP